MSSNNEAYLDEALGKDTIYLLDCSRSMGDKLGETKVSKLEIAKAVLVSKISSANYGPSDRIGVLVVSTNLFAKPIIREVIPLTEAIPLVQSSSPLFDRIMYLKNDGGTALTAGIFEALRVCSGKTSSKDLNIIGITDSRDNADVQPGRIVSEATKYRVKIHFIILGKKKGNKEKLQLVSDLTNGQLSYASDQYELENALEKLLPKRRQPEQVSEANVLASLQTEVARPAVTPLRRRKTETPEEIQAAASELITEYSGLEKKLRADEISQSYFTEKYSIIQYELNLLRQAIREQRSKLSKEMTEVALLRTSMPNNSDLLKEIDGRLTELDKQISSLYQSAKIVN